MKRLEKDGMTLFSPSDVPDLHDIYGLEFEKKYVEYEKKAEKGDIKLFKKVKAKDLWRKVYQCFLKQGILGLLLRIHATLDHHGTCRHSTFI